MNAVLTIRGLGKTFPGTRALDGVDLDVRSGEVRALLGENGAGKSTLIKIIGGFHQPSSGRLQLDGADVSFATPAESQAHGISVITQEFSLVPTMTVTENIFLGHELRRGARLLDIRRMGRDAKALLTQLGVDIDPNRRVETLSVADQQLVEIAKALSTKFRLLVLDEPTAALAGPDVERLFAVITRLRAEGVAMLYVSHRLSEVTAIADTVSVLRDGRLVGSGAVADLDEDDLTEMIVGHAVEAVTVDISYARPERALEVTNASVPGLFEGISLHVARGEVLGLAGLAGSGRAELCNALVGRQGSVGAGMVIDGVSANVRGPMRALRAGVATLVEDRKAEGILPDLSVRENLVISKERRPARLISRRSEDAEYERFRQRLRIKAVSPEVSITSLSGGNQQKVLIARALATGCRILILNEPTRGVDVNAKAEIHRLVRELAQEGYAIIVSSSDVPELVAVCDRCLVMVGGRQAAVLDGDGLTVAAIVATALGTGEGAA